MTYQIQGLKALELSLCAEYKLPPISVLSRLEGYLYWIWVKRINCYN